MMRGRSQQGLTPVSDPLNRDLEVAPVWHFFVPACPVWDEVKTESCTGMSAFLK
jgi:hypothetical protein